MDVSLKYDEGVSPGFRRLLGVHESRYLETCLLAKVHETTFHLMSLIRRHVERQGTTAGGASHCLTMTWITEADATTSI